MNSSRIVAAIMNTLTVSRQQQRRCHRAAGGSLSLVLMSNLFRAVSGAGFLAPSSKNGLLQNLQQRQQQPNVGGSFCFQKIWYTTMRESDDDNNNNDNDGPSETKPKNPFLDVSLSSKDSGDSKKKNAGDDGDAPSTRNRLLKQKKNMNTGSSSWMERNDAFSQTTAEESTSSPPRSKRRFDASSSSSFSPPRRSSSSSQGDRRERSDFGERRRSDSGGGERRGRSDLGGGERRGRSDFGSGGGERRGRSDFGSGGGERRGRSEFSGGGERRGRSEFSGGSERRGRSEFSGGGERRGRSEFSGERRGRSDFDGERRQSSSSSSSFRGRRDDQGGRRESSFRRWDSQEDDKPREWSSTRNRRGDNQEDGERSGKTFRQDFRGTRVFVQGLGPDTTWQQLKDHFRVAGEVVFASVSIDPRTGESKGHGIVQYETTEMASNAISVMREHPLDGETLYVRADVQEKKTDQQDGLFNSRGATRSRDNSVSSQRPYSSPSLSSASSKPSSTWRCADEETVELIPEGDQDVILDLIKSRDAARRQRDYDASDDLRAELKTRFGVHLDDRLKMWWVSLDGKEIPTSIREAKGDGRWGKAQAWRQIPTLPENDACVNPDLVNGLLTQRDIARKEKDFTTADKLLEQARISPDGDLVLRIHDESRTWRVWTGEPPPREVQLRPPPRKSPSEQCLELVRKYAPHKEDEIKLVLEKFQGREYKVLRKLKQRYLKKYDVEEENDDDDQGAVAEAENDDEGEEENDDEGDVDEEDDGGQNK